MKFTDTDRYQLSRACLGGCADEMAKSSHAMSAIIRLLQLDLNGEIELNDFHREGLLNALDQMTAGLSRRASFAESQLDKEFENDD
ncbi:hypothetical protein [Billgrantia ethanolica]|uniref:Uncharacterized protein n=1 Tax=Billgrantia ethanolica TaxID=2733486 RepID=A0ABS9A1N3_9GAMM|nr:hypothetical protein [Halomonas ethanolica]MCE8002716.1 hypothetical protein [Halomonas ethanolica]